MRKHAQFFFLWSLVIAAVPLLAGQPTAADQTVERLGRRSEIREPAQWPSVALVQDRKQIKTAIDGVGCVGPTGEPCNNDWGDMGSGDGTGGSTDFGGCKTNYVCFLSAGACGPAAYAHCADRVSGTPGAPCQGC